MVALGNLVSHGDLREQRGRGVRTRRGQERMAKRVRAVSSILACLVLCLPYGAPAGVGMRTDKEQAHLTGPVRTVRIEVAAGMADPSGARAEGAPQLESVLTYDLNGYLTEAIPGPPPGGDPAKVLYRYDTQGLRYEALRVSADGRLLSRSVYVYTYDARGNPTEMLPYHRGSFTEAGISRLVYLYDEQGHLKQT